jgi:hypothetical protein
VAAVVGVVALGWWLRAQPLLAAGPLHVPVDYDEGVYFATSGLLARGVLPYRDLVFVHPPGWPLLLIPIAGPLAAVIGVDHAFAVALVAATVIGAATTFLLWRLGTRLRGPVAGLVAAALYATHPLVVAAERGTFLEPALNLLVVAAALVWLRTDDAGARRHQLAAGALFAGAVLVKTWGTFSALAALASLPVTSWATARTALRRLVLGALVVSVVVVGPFLVVAPRHLVTDIVGFQLFRAPDGALLADRLRILFEPLYVRNRAQLWGASHVVSATGALLGAALALGRAWRREARGERFVLVLAATMVGAFLVGRSFYAQYLAHLAVPEVLLAGYAAGTAWAWLGDDRRLRWARPVLALVLAATPLLPARQSVLGGRARTDELLALARTIDAEVPDDACLFAFEPAWGLVAGRFPPTGDGRPAIADPYATMLLPTARRGEHFEGIGPAFVRPESQVAMRRLLARCDWVVYGGRGPAQLSAASEAWFTGAYERRAVVPGPAGLDLWERR